MNLFSCLVSSANSSLAVLMCFSCREARSNKKPSSFLDALSIMANMRSVTLMGEVGCEPMADTTTNFLSPGIYRKENELNVWLLVCKQSRKGLVILALRLSVSGYGTDSTFAVYLCTTLKLAATSRTYVTFHLLEIRRQRKNAALAATQRFRERRNREHYLNDDVSCGRNSSCLADASASEFVNLPLRTTNKDLVCFDLPTSCGPTLDALGRRYG